MTLTPRAEACGWGLLLAAGLLVGGLAWAERAAGRPAGREEPLARQLDRLSDAVAYRLEAKTLVTHRLLAGRLTLLEAAAEFRALNQTRHEHGWDWWETAHPGVSAEEGHCREVLAWAGAALAKASPGEAR